MSDLQALVDEVSGVIRHYDGQLKKQHKRIIKLDARGSTDEQREQARQSIRKYQIVLAALEEYRGGRIGRCP